MHMHMLVHVRVTLTMRRTTFAVDVNTIMNVVVAASRPMRVPVTRLRIAFVAVNFLVFMTVVFSVHVLVDMFVVSLRFALADVHMLMFVSMFVMTMPLVLVYMHMLMDIIMW